jgi:hypothetical protein
MEGDQQINQSVLQSASQPSRNEKNDSVHRRRDRHDDFTVHIYKVASQLTNDFSHVVKVEHQLRENRF